MSGSVASTTVAEGAFALHDHQRPQEAGAAECRSGEAQTSQALGGSMAKNPERWMDLCELAGKEQDAQRLMELTEEIVRLLDERRKLSSGQQDNSPVK
jgi:hypothetical protein